MARPVDVRLAEALGYGEKLKWRRGRWELLDRVMGEGIEVYHPVPQKSSDYAWCGEVQHRNDLDVYKNAAHGWNAWCPMFRDVVALSFPDPRIAICEWVIAAIAAGVRVVLPGGRVVN